MRGIFGLLVVAVLAYAFFRVKTQFDLFKTFEFKNDHLCTRHDVPHQVEDFVRFGDVLVGGMANNIDLFIDPTKGPSVTKDGALVAVKADPYSFEIIKIKDFPEGVAFNPFGNNLYKKSTLNVVNYAYSRGGTRIEVFDLRKHDGEVEAKHIKSIKFGPEFEGIINSVIQVGDNDYYINTWHPFADSPEGRAHDPWTSMKRAFLWTFTRSTYLWHCKVSKDAPTCYKVYAGRIMNGMDISGDKLYVADGGDKKILEYQLEADKTVTLISEINLDLNIDNVSVGKDGKIYATGPILMTEVVQRFSGGNNKISTSVAELERRGDHWVAVNIISQDKVSGASVAAPLGDYLVLGSFEDTAIGVCRKP